MMEKQPAAGDFFLPFFLNLPFVCRLLGLWSSGAGRETRNQLQPALSAAEAPKAGNTLNLTQTHSKLTQDL